MKHKWWIIVIIGIIGILGIPERVSAEETAGFHVQTAELQEDGTIKVSVYLTDTSNLGGVDAEFAYDSEKVAYVNSGLGNTFSGGYGETNHVEAESIVKCVAVFPEAKTAHGELFYAVFKLNGIASYQPEFRVADLLDASVEINPIPYTITYQQADGSWTDTRDVSEQQADASVAAQARETFGAAEDQESEALPQNRESESSAEEKDSIDQNEVEYGNKETKVKKMKNAAKGNLALPIVIVAGVIVVVAGVIIWRMRGKRRNEL